MALRKRDSEHDERTRIVRLVEEHHPTVYRYAYRLCGGAADAEDLSQETFLRAQKNLAQLRDSANAKAWLLAITRNCFLGIVRRKRPTGATQVDLDIDSVEAENADELEAYDLERLQLGLNALPDEQRAIVLMHYFEYLTYREIAECLDAPIGTVMSRLARAKARLRKSMTKEKVDSRHGMA